MPPFSIVIKTGQSPSSTKEGVPIQSDGNDHSELDAVKKSPLNVPHTLHPEKDYPLSPGKHVRFNRAAKVRKIPKRSLYSEEQRAEMWYTAKELEEVIRNSDLPEPPLQIGVDTDDFVHSSEYKLAKQHKLRQTRRLAIRQVIVDDCKKAKLLAPGADRSEEIASRYKAYNQVCVMEAIERAEMDAHEAFGV